MLGFPALLLLMKKPAFFPLILLLLLFISADLAASEKRLLEKITQVYQKRVSESIQSRLKIILASSGNTANAHYDLAQLAIQQKHLVIARYHFTQARLKAPNKLLYLAWYVDAVTQIQGLSLDHLKRLERLLTQGVKVGRPNSFALRALADLQTKIAKSVKGTSAGEWFEKARATVDFGLEQQFSSSSQDYAYSGTLFIAHARWYHSQYQSARVGSENHPTYAKYNKLKLAYDNSKTHMAQLEQQALRQFAEVEQSPEVQERLALITQLEADLVTKKALLIQQQQALIVLAKLAEQLEKNILVAKSSEYENVKHTYKATINEYNNQVAAINQMSRKNNETIARINDEKSKHQIFLNTKHRQTYQAFNQLVSKHNKTIIPQYNRLSEKVNQLDQLWKEPLFLRDQAYSNAMTHLLAAVAENPSDQVSAKQFHVLAEEVRQKRHGADKALFTERTWCPKINYHCERCQGLDVLACEVSQKDAQKACLADKTYQPFVTHRGNERIVGSCRHITPLRLEDKVITSASYLEKPFEETIADRQQRLQLARILVPLANTLFGENTHNKAPLEINLKQYLGLDKTVRKYMEKIPGLQTLMVWQQI